MKPNGTTLNNNIPENEQPTKENIDGMLEKAFHEPLVNETDTVPKMKQAIQEGKIAMNKNNTKLIFLGQTNIASKENERNVQQYQETRSKDGRSIKQTVHRN